MKIVHSERYAIDIGDHVFPTGKYLRVRERLLDRRLARPGDFVEPVAASWDMLALVHAAAYLGRLQAGLSWAEQAELELPWSPAVVEGFRLMTGGTVTAARIAVGLAADRGGPPDAAPRHPVTVHLGGGFHHAFPDHGEGFCMFNDVAVAIRLLQRDGAIRRAAIVDCDVHQGNGTATVFASDPSVFTFSMHQMHNYPAVKPPGSLDIGLPDATADAEYLRALGEALPRVMASGPDVLFYLAGADPYDGDQLGGLCLTKEGLRRRDHAVFAAARAAGVPVVVVLAGGYARRIEDTVDIHVATVEEAARGGERLCASPPARFRAPQGDAAIPPARRPRPRRHSFREAAMTPDRDGPDVPRAPESGAATARVLGTRPIYSGRIFSVSVDRVRLPHGPEVTLEVVRHRGSAILLPMPDPSTVILVRQYRYAVDRWMWELPAGSLEAGEDPARGAARECEEEIRLIPGRVELVGRFYPTPGFCDEEMNFFRLTALREPGPGVEPAARDEDENLEVRAFDVAELRRMVARGDIVDLKTVAGLALLAGG